jgi:hypothetical protein
MKRFFSLIATGLLVALLGGGFEVVYADSQAEEYRLKAVFLLNFARFAQWPSSAFAAHETELVVGILGRDPYGDALKQLQGMVVHGRKVRISYMENEPDPSSCQLVFIAGSESPRLAEYLLRFKGFPVLLVSDIPQFGERGGHIELYTRHNKVRFRINLAGLKSSNIILSSKLLHLAELVERQ